MEVLPLHRHEYLTDACTDILNTYWPRSKGARIHSLSKSCDHLPVCLAFVKQDGSKLEVLGFSKISAVQGILNACLVESVIVRDKDRGKGLGRILMNLTEEYAKKLGMKAMYLNTLDQEGFYERIGYIKCSPVISLGENAHRVPETMLRRLLGTSIPSPLTKELNSNGTQCHSACRDFDIEKDKNDNNASLLYVNSSKLNSKEVLYPTAPPLPPPLPLPKQHSSLGSSYSRAVVRMDPNCVTWMKKDL